MSIRYWLSILVLITSLSATIAAIYLLKSGHMTQFWTSLGFQAKENILNWCDERVHSIYFYEKDAKIIEESGKWFWRSSEDVTLDYLTMEKWLARYCHLAVAPAKISDGETTALFEVEFINGDRVSFHGLDDDHIQVRGTIYQSPTLRKAFKELLAFDPKLE